MLKDEALPAGYASVGQVLTCPFVLVNTLMNMLVSIGMSRLVFWLLFDELGSAPPGGLWPWYSPNLIGVVVGSSILVSPTLVMALAPAGMPSALARGWLFRVRTADVPPWLWRCSPCLWDTKLARVGLGRHFLLGLQLSVLYIPVPILLAYFCYAPLGGFTTMQLIWFDVWFETALALPSTLLGLLAFSMEHNCARVEATMAKELGTENDLDGVGEVGVDLEGASRGVSIIEDEEEARAHRATAASTASAASYATSIGSSPSTVGRSSRASRAQSGRSISRSVIGSLRGSLRLLG